MDHSYTFISKFLEAVDFQYPVEVTNDTLLADLPEWDSLAALGVIVMADMEYQKTIVGEDLKQCSTVGDLARLIAG